MRVDVSNLERVVIKIEGTKVIDGLARADETSHAVDELARMIRNYDRDRCVSVSVSFGSLEITGDVPPAIADDVVSLARLHLASGGSGLIVNFSQHLVDE